jgi:hypothetical protein
LGTCNLQGTSTKPGIQCYKPKYTPNSQQAFGRVLPINHVTVLFPYMEAQNIGRKNIKLCGWNENKL